MLLFHPGYTARSISEERHRWNRRFSEPLKRFILPHANDRSPKRPLRIGYVSPDFRDHVVGRNLMPLFECHDRREFEVFCYAGVVQPDKLTEEFRQHAQRWRGTVGVSDEALADMIRRDGVDILVDLTQHMAGNRLPLFARKPAPVQVSFAGYPESTGLEAIEYRISDRYLEPGSADEETGRREQVHLIDSFWCYDPCGVEVEVNGLPARESGSVTFGCLNNFSKVNEPVLRLWARVLGKVKDSRLVLLSRIGSPRQRTLEVLVREGVEARRVEFVDFRPRREYLEMYHRLDIVLDTFPYNGHTTSLDALWMGVPVVSLAGKTPVSRAGLSQLTNVGLPELVAHLEEDYVIIAVELAGDLPRLAQLRSTLRARMQASVLTDAPRFTRQVEQAYRKMWQAWRHEQSAVGE
jgi:predicted O-linked N-acetylglucosamine transferase (SPINDLY family)